MSRWGALKNDLMPDRAATYAHTARENSELTRAPAAADSPADTLAFFRNDPDLAAAVRLLREDYPVVNQRFRYKRSDGRHRYILALDIALLLGAGWTHREIAKYLSTCRQGVTFMAQKLRAGGVPLRPSQHPKSAAPRQSQAPSRTDNRLNLDTIIEKLKRREISSGQAQLWLERQDEYYDAKYHARHVSIGVGAQAEKQLERLSRLGSDGKVNEARVVARAGRLQNADRLLERYWRGLPDDYRVSPPGKKRRHDPTPAESQSCSASKTGTHAA
ncbi:MAG TPA: hypothetical protein VMW24_09535 [Sedimentisphaerales bacterium]|nr:hypothetical protein [Sedimentisphaerales bacterium]